MKRKILYLLIVAVSLTTLLAVAGTVSTPTSTMTPGKYALRNADNTIPAGYTDATSRFDTLALCDAAIKAFKKAGKWKCDLSTLVTVTMTVTNTCTDEPAPRIYLPLVDLPNGNGTKGYELPEMEEPKLKPGSDVDYMPERDWLYVRDPKGDAAYPNCWIRGWEDPSKWRQNAVKDPGKVFMELITPQNVSENMDLPNSIEPMTTPAGFQEDWDKRQAEDAAACAAGDPKRCPQAPNQKPGACGWYYEPSCGPGISLPPA